MCPAVQVKPSPEGVPGAVTDPTRIRAEQLSFAGAQGTPVNGYLASPAGDDERARPAMIVIHTAAGLAEHAKDVVNRFANLGYVALGVDLYTREGGPPPMDDMQAVMRRLFAMSDATALGDLEGAADFLRARWQVGGKVGCIGPPWTSARPRHGPRRRSSWLTGCSARCWRRSARRTATPPPRWASSCEGRWKPAGRR